jgi:hypothetical protein
MARSGELSQKEAAFLAQVKREVAQASPATTKRTGGHATRGAVPMPPMTPLDQQTVMGWDHPEAARAPARVKIAAEEKWQRMAELLEAEKRSEVEKRARMKKVCGYVLLAVSVALLVITLLALRR